MINPAPNTPAKIPVMILPGSTSIVGAVIGDVPNLSTEEEIVLTVSPSRSALKMAKLETEMAHETKTFHMTVNFQNVLGFEISYAKSVPPTGAPKAAETPADVPAAIRYLLFLSLRNHSNYGRGK